MIRVLGHYQLHGVLIRRIVKKPGYVKPPQFEAILTAYERECELNEYSKRGMRTRIQQLFFFIDYLNSRQVQAINDVTPEIISDYVKTIFPHHEKSISAILTTLRVFLRFLYLNNYIEEDLAKSVPKQNKYYYPSVPSTWRAEEVHRMLECIDRGNPTGKRDYAILLLAARLGIRAGDIKSLKLSNLNWNTKSIVITQQKTKNITSYPILNAIGWAIIDYLKSIGYKYGKNIEEKIVADVASLFKELILNKLNWIGRYDMDSFLIVLNNENSIKEILDILNQLFSNFTIRYSDIDTKVTTDTEVYSVDGINRNVESILEEIHEQFHGKNYNNINCSNGEKNNARLSKLHYKIKDMQEVLNEVCVTVEDNFDYDKRLEISQYLDELIVMYMQSLRKCNNN
ncbi:tyrosine-type recombinase/integrase [Clostridium sp. UBA1353]|uniref:tyrosine-type recombinase/integrase n=1 Tax=Clostridium sp. UBA1353 TaxID=1946347 RepID=UPI0012432639